MSRRKKYHHRRGWFKKTGPKKRIECGTPKFLQKEEHAIRLKKDLEFTKANLSRTASLMFVGRSTVYRMIDAWGLWPYVNEIRRKRLEQTQVEADGLLQRTKLALRG